MVELDGLRKKARIKEHRIYSGDDPDRHDKKIHCTYLIYITYHIFNTLERTSYQVRAKVG